MHNNQSLFIHVFIGKAFELILEKGFEQQIIKGF